MNCCSELSFRFSAVGLGFGRMELFSGGRSGPSSSWSECALSCSLHVGLRSRAPRDATTAALEGALANAEEGARDMFELSDLRAKTDGRGGRRLSDTDAQENVWRRGKNPTFNNIISLFYKALQLETGHHAQVKLKATRPCRKDSHSFLL